MKRTLSDTQSIDYMRKVVVVGAVCGAVMVAGGQDAYATYIRGAESVTTTIPDISTPTLDYNVTNIIDQSGLSSTYIDGVTDFDSYVSTVTHNWVPEDNEWWTAWDTATGSVLFDLGGVYTVDKLALWNEDWSGLVELGISFSLDNINFTSIGTFFPTDNVYEQWYAADIFDFGLFEGPMQYIRFDLVAAAPDPYYPTHPTLSMGEVAFSVAEPVPEPATILLFGTGALGLFGMRRKKRQVSECG